ncbi:hypothetical protein FDP41_002649 [Naegleria fowleri]|uniref:Uncharacterized protein n=1 Tax=Naegleria fowleri TaxID=5763 RepID=A0A6A5BTE3_NAEFO|nr:uncharacterized protein FDP41_002957 [Naegleria fowleri]XP_044562847.1 uncharacterized protein FDP41_002649 [Naegleria fowleri]KAF0978002.1 hypothetical protein FDP41_002957 [Naegleria fowleri]KAF0978134.1 hypothetical protein FDP41_002649 [Naegleria fowleri]
MGICNKTVFMGCCSCCAVYSLISMFILLYLGILIIVSAYPFSKGVNDHVYETRYEKAQGFFIAAGLYFLFVLLGVGVTVGLYFKKKRE